MSESAPPTVFGIDLGTTYSAIAYVDEFGKPVIVPNEDNVLVTPSVVYFESAQNVLVGNAARESGRVDPPNFVELIKRSMGDSAFRREIHGREYRPEDISAFILKKLKTDAEKQLGREVKDAIITVPAYFNEAQRTATEQAGQIAGLNVRGIIPEPTAAAIAYAASDAAEQSILVFDLGGGTFDVTVMKVEAHKVRVVCISGDHDLGGRNWDERTVALLAEEWKAKNGAADDPLNSPETVQELFRSAEDAKRLLSRLGHTPIRVNHAGLPARVDLTREKFDELTSALLERTISLTRDTLAEAARLGVPQIDLVLLVGGSSYMPQVQERLKAEFPNTELKLFEPEQAVAKGAAIYAATKQIQDAYEIAMRDQLGRTDLDVDALPADKQRQLEDQVLRALPSGTRRGALEPARKMQIINACSKSFGLVVVTDPATRREGVAYLIRRNTAVPATLEDIFTTLDHGQTDVAIRIIEAEGPEPPESPTDPRCREIKKVTLNLPDGLPAGHPIAVKYSLSEDGGRLRVEATDRTSGRAVDDSVETFDALMPQELKESQERLAQTSVS